MLLLPGVGVTYYGDEIGMEDTFVSWEDTVDPSGIRAGREGYAQSSRDPERTPFEWDNTTSAGEYKSNSCAAHFNEYFPHIAVDNNI